MKLSKFDETSEPETSGLQIVLFSALSLCLVSLLSICLYCLFGKRRKKKLAAGDDSHIAINEHPETTSNGNGVGSRASNPHNPLTKLSSLFSATSAFSGNRTFQSQNSVDSQYQMGQDQVPVSMRYEAVQPAAKPYGGANQKQNLARKPSGLLKLIGNEIFPEENNKPPSGAEYIGKLQYSVAYDFQDMTLTVRIIKAVDLPAMDLSGTSDPFVKCCLLPDRKRKLETNIRRKTCNPSWGETFLFEGLPYDKVQQRVLYMQVMDYDRFSRNDPIGEIYLPLHTLDLTDATPKWEYLAQCKGSNKRGALLLSLEYEPLKGVIQITVHKARDLKPMDLNGTSDPYVKIWLLYKGKRMDKKKTVTRKNCLNPDFDTSFEFDCPMERLRDTQVEISVMDKDYVGRNEVIGKIYLGYKSQSIEKQHWKDMLNNVRTPIQQWHVLKV